MPTDPFDAELNEIHQEVTDAGTVAGVAGLAFGTVEGANAAAEAGIAGTLGAVGTVVNMPPGASTATIESKTNFIGGAAEGTTVTGESTPVHKGRTTQVWQTRVTTAEGKLVALVTQTQIVKPAKV